MSVMRTSHRERQQAQSVLQGNAGVWIIVPAFNEATRIGKTLESLVTKWPNIVVIDDGSTDRTQLVARQYPVILLRHMINRGQGAALRTGIDFALRQGARWLVTFDADGQHSADDVQRILAPVLSGETELTLGSRFLSSSHGSLPFGRRLLLQCAVVFTRVHTGLALTDAHNGLRAMTRAAAQQLDLQQDRMAHASELLKEIGRMRIPFKEVPVSVSYTEETLAKGQHAWGAISILLDLFTHLIMFRRQTPPSHVNEELMS